MTDFKNIKWRVEQIFYGTPKTKSGCYILLKYPLGEAEIRVELETEQFRWAKNSFRRNKSGKLVKITKRTPEWVKLAITAYPYN